MLEFIKEHLFLLLVSIVATIGFTIVGYLYFTKMMHDMKRKRKRTIVRKRLLKKDHKQVNFKK